MNRHAVIAFGAVILIATGGVIALKSIDRDKGRSALAMPAKAPVMTAEEAAKILPPPAYVPSETPPPPPPKLAEPIQPVWRFDEPFVNPRKDFKSLSPHDQQMLSPEI